MANDPTILQDESVQARFWSLVDLRGENECWPWMGGTIRKDSRGYFFARNMRWTAPNAALRIMVGDPPEEKQFACHSCDNPNCVNPAHLWWGSVRDNALDASAKGRLGGMSKTYCLRGHEFTPENTLVRVNKTHGWTQRVCRECKKIHAARYDHRVRKANRKRSPELVANVERARTALQETADAK